MTPEGKVKEKIDKILKKYDVWYDKPARHVMGRRGKPDYTCLAHGNTAFWIEAKAGKGKPSDLQLIEHADIRRHGGTVFIINETNLYSLEEFLEHKKEVYNYAK